VKIIAFTLKKGFVTQSDYE